MACDVTLAFYLAISTKYALVPGYMLRVTITHVRFRVNSSFVCRETGLDHAMAYG